VDHSPLKQQGFPSNEGVISTQFDVSVLLLMQTLIFRCGIILHIQQEDV